MAGQNWHAGSHTNMSASDIGALRAMDSVVPVGVPLGTSLSEVQQIVNENAGIAPVFFEPQDTTWGGSLTVPSGAFIYALPGTVTLRNARLSTFGSTAAEVDLSSPAAKYATTLTLASTTGMEAGDWLRIVSCINANSNDAGADQLGGRKADNSMLAEFVQILSVDSPTQVTLASPTIFPYSNTAGTDSSTRTVSTVFPVTWTENVRIQGLNLVGPADGFSEMVKFSFANNCEIRDCQIDTNNTASMVAARFNYSLNCRVRGGRYVCRQQATTSSENNIIIRSCQNCTVKDVRLEYGFQGADITYINGDSTNWGGPSIDCGVSDSTAAWTANDGFTDHPGCTGSHFFNLSCEGAPARALRIRSPKAHAAMNHFSGPGSSSGVGIFVEGGFVQGTKVVDNSVDGFQEGITFQPEETTSTSQPVTAGTAEIKIEGNDVRNCDFGIYMRQPSHATALIHSPRIVGNTIQDCTEPIINSSYVNGTVIEDNLIYRVTTSGKSGIYYQQDCKRLTIGVNHIYGVDASAYALRGDSATNQITDLTTFPGNEAEALLTIYAQITDAATPYSNVYTSALQTYSASNVSADRTFDASSTTVGELANVLGSLIADLRAKNLVL